jgi:predicted DNA-binding transcriptional regulator YafY
MPNHAKSSVIRRQWEMLRLVPAFDHPGKSASELAAALEQRGYTVTVRTVERDLGTLSDCLPLEANAKVRPQRWRWAKSKIPDLPGMESAEAMALFMMQDAVQAHLPTCFSEALRSRFTQADKTLASLARAGANVRWADRVRVIPSHVVLQPPRIAPRILQALQKATLNEVPVDTSYQSLQDAEPRERRMYPRALILRGSSLYLVAHTQDGGTEPHHYAVQRFSAVKLRELEAWPAGKFSLEAFLADGRNQFGDGRDIRLVAYVSAHLHKTLGDSPLSADMQLVPEADRGYRLTATVRDTWALKTWILGHAENITVLEPAALREAVAKQVKAAAQQYA